MPAIRCNPGRAVGPRASSGPAPVAAFREQPPPGTISDPPWFPHPSPFVWPFCKTRKQSYDQPRQTSKSSFSTLKPIKQNHGCRV